MPVTVYKHNDASAPVLTGLAGSLTALLDAVLVTGYGAKAAAGWTIEFTAANKRVYRPPLGVRHYFRVDDTAPNATASGREAQLRGFEAMTTVDAGTGPFPTTAQFAVSGLGIRKSMTADATARPWVAVADGRTCYLFILSGDYSGYGGTCFGEIFSLKTGDLWRSIAVGRAAQGTDLDTDDRLQDLTPPAIAAATVTGHYMPRSAIGFSQAATLVGKHGDGIKGANFLLVTGARIGNGMVVYPNPADGGLYMSQVWVHEDQGNNMIVRGRMRGFWAFLHPVGSPVNDGDTFAGTGPLAGKTFLVIKPVAMGDGLYVMETSDTWEASA